MQNPFFREGVSWIMLIGLLTAPFENWMDTKEWYLIDNLVSYLSGKKIIYGYYNVKKSELIEKDSIRFQSEIQKPVYVKVLRMFDSSSEIKKWKPDFQQYSSKNK